MRLIFLFCGIVFDFFSHGVFTPARAFLRDNVNKWYIFNYISSLFIWHRNPACVQRPNHRGWRPYIKWYSPPSDPTGSSRTSQHFLPFSFVSNILDLTYLLVKWHSKPNNIIFHFSTRFIRVITKKKKTVISC